MFMQELPSTWSRRERGHEQHPDDLQTKLAMD
jgi:hypothetical protein